MSTKILSESLYCEGKEQAEGGKIVEDIHYTMTSTAAVDGTLHECVLEYSAVLDHFAGNKEFSEKVSAYATETAQDDQSDEEEEQEAVQYSDDLFGAIAESAPLLNKVNDREFEDVANLAVYILSLGDDSDARVEKLVTDLISLQDLQEKLVKNKKKTIKVLSIISVLSNVFNTFDSASLQKTVLAQILQLVEVLDNVSLLQPFVSNIETILLAKSSDESVREIVLKTAQLIQSEDPLGSLKLQYLSLTKIEAPTQELANNYIVNSLNTPSALDLSSVIGSEVISNLASKELLDYTNAYLYTKHDEFIQSKAPESVDTDIVTKKNQYLTLLQIASGRESLSYKTIASEVGLEEADVELFLINAIKLKIIEGKISQLENTFLVYKVKLVVKKIESSDWKQIKETLTNYKNSLKEVKQLIDQVQNRRSKN